MHKEATIAFSFSDGSYEIHRQRPYDYGELAPLLNDAGLKAIHLFSWFSRIPYSSNTPKLFCVAEKRNQIWPRQDVQDKIQKQIDEGQNAPSRVEMGNPG